MYGAEIVVHSFFFNLLWSLYFDIVKGKSRAKGRNLITSKQKAQRKTPKSQKKQKKLHTTLKVDEAACSVSHLFNLTFHTVWVSRWEVSQDCRAINPFPPKCVMLKCQLVLETPSIHYCYQQILTVLPLRWMNYVACNFLFTHLLPIYSQLFCSLHNKDFFQS